MSLVICKKKSLEQNQSLHWNYFRLNGLKQKDMTSAIISKTEAKASRIVTRKK